MTKNTVVLFGAMLCCFLWGSAFPCIKIGYALMNISAEDANAQILYAGIRFFVAGILTILIGSGMQKKLLFPKRRALGKVAVLSVFQTILQYIFFYIGLAHTSGVKASIIEGMNVFLAIVIARFLFRMEEVATRKWIGCMIGFLGVVLVNLTGGDVNLSFHFSGEGFIFFSAVASAFSSVFIKKYSKEENAVMLSGYQFMFGGFVMIICALFMGGRLYGFTVAAFLMLLYLALVSAVAYSVWSILLKYNPVSKVTVFGFMNPVIGVMLSAVLLKETDMIQPISVLALFFVCIGIYMVNSESKKTKKG